MWSFIVNVVTRWYVADAWWFCGCYQRWEANDASLELICEEATVIFLSSSARFFFPHGIAFSALVHTWICATWLHSWQHCSCCSHFKPLGICGCLLSEAIQVSDPLQKIDRTSACSLSSGIEQNVSNNFLFFFAGWVFSELHFLLFDTMTGCWLMVIFRGHVRHFQNCMVKTLSRHPHCFGSFSLLISFLCCGNACFNSTLGYYTFTTFMWA